MISFLKKIEMDFILTVLSVSSHSHYDVAHLEGEQLTGSFTVK